MRKLSILLLACALLLYMGAQPADAAQVTQNDVGENVVENASFEEGVSNDYEAEIPGWVSLGDTSTDKIEPSPNTRDGQYQLTHYSSVAYSVYTQQTITGLTDGLYTLKVWVKQKSNPNAETYIFVKDNGAEPAEYKVEGVSSSEQELVMLRNIEVSGEQCTIGFYSSHKGGGGSYWINFDAVEFYLQGDAEVGEAELTDMLGNPVDDLSSRDFVMVNMRISNVSDKTISAALITAIYDENNVMVNIGLVEKHMAPGETAVLKTGFKLPGNKAGHTIRVFAWDSLQGMKPLSSPAMFSLD